MGNVRVCQKRALGDDRENEILRDTEFSDEIP